MTTYIVLFIEPDALPADPPQGFKCQAEDSDHAEEQCLNAYPNASIAWVHEGASAVEAYQEYWGHHPEVAMR